MGLMFEYLMSEITIVNNLINQNIIYFNLIKIREKKVALPSIETSANEKLIATCA